MDTTQPLSMGSASLIAERYQLGELVGRGATAEVFKARDEVLGRTVAVKVFHHDALTEDDAARRRSEIEILASMNHRGLVTIFDAGSEIRLVDPRSYVVMEYVDGQTLSRELAGGPMPTTVVAALGAQLADALGYIHDRGVVHRDVKPANILLTRDGSTMIAKLADFGIARHTESTRMTAVGSTIGTASYLSPEQVTGAPITPAGDMYSFGLVLLECLAGRPMFPGQGIEAALVRLRQDPPMPVSLDPAWTALLTALTSRDPAQRPAARETRDRLLELAAPSGPGEDATELLGPLEGIAWLSPPAHAAPSRHRGRLLAAGAGVAALGVAVVLALTAADRPAAPTPATSSSTTSNEAGGIGSSSAPSVAVVPTPATTPTPAAPASLTVVSPTPGAAHGNGKSKGKKSP
jgi:serine/threonine protein kinase